MLNNSNYLDKLKHTKNVQQLLNNAYILSDKLFLKELKYLKIDDYDYDPEIASEELGLDLELIDQLIEDYVRQILHAQTIFVTYINILKDDKKNNKELDYTNLREFAHKNLGVARNLRIVVAEKILFRMMKSDDIENMLIYLEALIATTIILNPECAYKEITIRNIKESI